MNDEEKVIKAALDHIKNDVFINHLEKHLALLVQNRSMKVVLREDKPIDIEYDKIADDSIDMIVDMIKERKTQIFELYNIYSKKHGLDLTTKK